MGVHPKKKPVKKKGPSSDWDSKGKKGEKKIKKGTGGKNLGPAFEVPARLLATHLGKNCALALNPWWAQATRALPPPRSHSLETKKNGRFVKVFDPGGGT